MELIEAIKSRKSIRGYQPTPVPKEILTEILEVATRAPSGLNSQPWEFTVLGGKVLDDLKQALEERFRAGTPPDADLPTEALTGVYRERQKQLGIALYQLMGIAREDTEKKTQWLLKGMRVFNAPNAIVVYTDQEVSGLFATFSLGAVTQTIALAALNYDLGTCIQGAPLFYPKVVRQITGIPESKKLAIAIAIGYPDWDFPANRLQTTREPLANIATWRGL